MDRASASDKRPSNLIFNPTTWRSGRPRRFKRNLLISRTSSPSSHGRSMHDALNSATRKRTTLTDFDQSEHTFKRLCLPSGSSHATPHNENTYNKDQDSGIVRTMHLAYQAMSRRLRADVALLTQEKSTRTQELANCRHQRNLYRLSLEQKISDAKSCTQRVKEIFIRDWGAMWKAYDKLERQKKKLEEQSVGPSNRSQKEVQKHDQLQEEPESAPATENEELRASFEASRRTAEQQAREIAMLRAECEQWRGQTVPPRVIPKTLISDDHAKKKRNPDPAFVLAHLHWFREPTTMITSGEPLTGEDTEEEKRRDNIMTERLLQRQKKVNAKRKEVEAEYFAAQKNFEERNLDAVPIGKVLQDFRSKELVSFSKGPTGSVRRAAVYPVQLRRKNKSVHILPFPTIDFILPRKYAEYAKRCLNAQLPELQAEAAKEFLSEEEYSNFMERSFGPEWQSLDLSNKEVDAEQWKEIVAALRGEERFKTACRMWAAGERALNQERCWPPTFTNIQKTQSCTQFTNEQERTKIWMNGLEGSPAIQKSPRRWVESDDDE